MNIIRPLILFLGLMILPGCMSNHQRPAPVSAYGTTEGVGSRGVHTVEPGDTLWTISLRYDIAMRDIADTNNLQPPYRLVNGQRLRLPPPYEYKARNGDSIYTVSRIFRVSPSELARLNNLNAPYRLNPGQIIRLPSVNARAAAPFSGMVEASPGAVASVEDVTSETLPPSGASASVPTAPQTASSRGVAVLPSQNTTGTVVKNESARTAQSRNNPIMAETPHRSSGKFLKPVKGRIISGYGPKEGGFHNDGINIEAPRGAPVHASENGVVVYAGDKLKGSGNLVLIRHEGRWMTAYAHMDSIAVKRGDIVKYGQTIGKVGSTGSVDSPQLHFELRRGTEALNPQAYLDE